jgi:hypothetical protein
MLPGERYVIPAPGSFQNSKTFGDDLLSDPVTFNDGNFVMAHRVSKTLERVRI